RRLGREIAERNQLQEQLGRRHHELTETTALLNSILESSTEYGIIATDLDGRIVAWNEGARRNSGYTTEEVVGKQDLRPPPPPEDARAGRVQALREAARQAGKAEATLTRVRKDGSRFTASAVVTLRTDAAGALRGYLLVSRDITEQRRLEE